MFDGLDQTPSSIVNLARVLQSPHYAGCRVFVAGRPYSLQQHWNELFERRDWLFVRVEEFTETQQKQYLGTTANNQSRWQLLPEDARQILGTPRVLQYVRTIADTELPRLRTAADVYVQAVDVLLREGMAESSYARLLGWKVDKAPPKVDPQNLSEGWKLLGAIAMEMTTQQIVVADPKAAPGTKRVPNFDRVAAGRAFDKFKIQIALRYQSWADAGLPQDLVALAALNDVLEHGVPATDLQGLQEVQFRNRSLQEFLCAYYLATDAFADQQPAGRTAERVKADEAWLDAVMYLPDRPETEEYYHVWQFLADMPAERHDSSGRPIRGREDSSWLRAIAPLYRPAVKVKTDWFRYEWQSRRSSEMIYRSWWSLNAYCDEGIASALALRDNWLGEFQQICEKRQGSSRQKAANHLRHSFLRLPSGKFLMGSPVAKQGMKPHDRAIWQETIDQARTEKRQIVVESVLDRFTWFGKLGRKEKKKFEETIHEAVSIGCVDVLADAWSPANETPEKNPQIVQAFNLSRQPVLNAWYRLYATGHGLFPVENLKAYGHYSESTDHPAIFLTWYDGWAFATWCHWNGVSCRLPFENEWEYAAKYGQEDPWQNYWWGEEFDKSRCNARNDMGTTTIPDAAHASEATRALDLQQHQQCLGVMDLLGNVWEWTADRYRPAYACNENDLKSCFPSVLRVLRGGAFYDVVDDSCRSAYRLPWNPGDTDQHCGVRLARSE
jgi:formylglycine-generating enzyme required for sulfatase activity